jgi:hypothetical protein
MTVARSAGTNQVEARIAAITAAPAQDPIGTEPRRNAMWVTKIISQTNNPPKSATSKNQT